MVLLTNKYLKNGYLVVINNGQYIMRFNGNGTEEWHVYGGDFGFWRDAVPCKVSQLYSDNR